MKIFLQKNQNFRTLEAPPPNPQISPPIANFWLRAWTVVELSIKLGWGIYFYFNKSPFNSGSFTPRKFDLK